MKKYIICLLTILSLGMISCQDELEKEFKNPDKYTPDEKDIVSGLWVNMLNQKMMWRTDYGEWWWTLGIGNGFPGYGQIACLLPFFQSSGYFDDFDNIPANISDNMNIELFNNFYTRLQSWGIIKYKIEKELTEAELVDNKIYLPLATIMKDWAAAKNVDLFNSIPYFNAFKGQEGVFFVPYDNPNDIYKSIIEDYKAIAEELPVIYQNMTAEGKTILKNQDFLFNGDIDRWVRFVNATRLKLAIRIEGVDREFAKEHIADLVSKNHFPTSDDAPDELAQNVVPGGGEAWRGWYERPYATGIPNIIMNRMNFGSYAYEQGLDDPRLPVIASPTRFADYRGSTMELTEAIKTWNDAGGIYYSGNDMGTQLERAGLSKYNLATFSYNNFPIWMMTMAEVDLLLAEAGLKGLANLPKSPGDYIRDAVIHSTQFWYDINSRGTKDRLLTIYYPQKPSLPIIQSYADKVKAHFEAQVGEENKMEILMQQKYIHLNLMGAYELFTELRRTRHPKLEPIKLSDEKSVKPQLERFKYPSSEETNNFENFKKVVKYNNYSSQIFWIPEQKRTESLYRNSYVGLKENIDQSN